MDETTKEVAIDTDFFNKFTNDCERSELLLQLMKDFHLSPVMHRFIYEDELHKHSLVKKMVEDGSIKIYDYSDYITKDNIDHYKDIFESAYQIFNYTQFSPGPHSDHFTYRKSRENLGEIRTSLMAWYLGINVFMSDDGDAKQFVESRLSSSRRPMCVYNVKDTLIQWFQIPDKTIKYADIKHIVKTELTSDKQQEVFAAWHGKGDKVS